MPKYSVPHGFRSLAGLLLTAAMPVASFAADKCPNFDGTYTGVDIKKVEFTTTIKQKACESLEITDSRVKGTITYTLDGKVGDDPQFDKTAKNASHLRSFFVGEMLVLEKYKEEEVDKKKELSKTATVIFYVKEKAGKKVLNASMISHTLERDKAPSAFSFDMGEKK